MEYVHEFSNDGDTAQELSYQLELNPNAFVSEFSAVINDETMIGITKEKEEAQREYNEAVERGLNAVLISQNHDAYTVSISSNLKGIVEESGEATQAHLEVIIEEYLKRRFGWCVCHINVSLYFFFFVLNRMNC